MQITSYPRGPMVRREAPQEVPNWTLAPLEGRHAPADEGASFRTPLPRLSAIGRAAAEQNLLMRHVRAEQAQQYRILLEETTDDQWRFEMAEGDERRAGWKHFELMRDLQEVVDPDGVLWRKFAPAGHAIPQPRARRSA